jgi:hypothetical protein
VDFGSGAFTARQLLVPPSIKGHIVVIPKGLNKLFITLPGVGTGPATLPAGATEALSGGITLDGNTAWVGVAGTNTLDRINLTNGADEVQLSLTALKKLDGTQAPPDVVGVRPH